MEVWVRRDHERTPGTIPHLTPHHGITYDLLYAITPLGATMLVACPATREPKACRFVSMNGAEDDSYSRVEWTVISTDDFLILQAWQGVLQNDCRGVRGHRQNRFSGEACTVGHHPELMRLEKMNHVGSLL